MRIEGLHPLRKNLLNGKGGVRTQHNHFTMGHINNAHHTKGNGKANGG